MGFWIAFAVGLAVVLLFAGEQFNRRSWSDARLRRVLGALNPNDLRGARARRRAFLFYLALLSTLYAVVVFLIYIGVLAWESGPEFAGGALPGDATTPEPQPWVPLAVSLGIIGLAPRSPVLKRIEEKLREKAHELMGIPAGLEEAGRRIEASDLTLDQIGGDYVTEADRERVGRYRSAALVLGSPARAHQLERMVLRLVAFRCWVLDNHWPTEQQRFRALELEIGKDIDAAFEAFDEHAKSAEEAAAPASPDADLAHREEAARRLEVLKRRWEKELEDVRDLCDEVCALMFVYADRERPDARRPAAVDRFFKGALGRNDQCPHLDILINSIGLAVAIAFVWGFALVQFAPQLGIAPPPRSASLNGVLVAISALFIYGPAMLAALWWRRRQDDPEPRPQVPVFALRRYVLVFAAGTVASLAVLMVYNMVQAIVVAGPPQTHDVLLLLLRYAATLEAPVAVLGGVQAVFVARYLTLREDLLEGWQSRALVAANGIALFAWSIVSVQLKIPQFGREPVWADYVIAAPVAGIIGLSIGTLMVVTLLRLRGIGRVAEAR
jgi:hypothetical protein